MSFRKCLEGYFSVTTSIKVSLDYIYPQEASPRYYCTIDNYMHIVQMYFLSLSLQIANDVKKYNGPFITFCTVFMTVK